MSLVLKKVLTTLTLEPKIPYVVIFGTKAFKLWTKNTFFKYFWDAILKNYCHTWHKHSSIFLEFFKMQSFIQNKKIEKNFHKLKNCKIEQLKNWKPSTLGPKTPYLGNFNLEFKNVIIAFDTSTFKFVKVQSFVKNK